MKDKSRSLLNLAIPAEKKLEAIVVSCVICPPVLEDLRLLQKLDLKVDNFISMPVIGVTDTLISRGAKKVMSGLVGVQLKTIILSKGISKVLILTHINCKHDFVVNKPGNQSNFEFRLSEMRAAENNLKSWLPPTSEKVVIESYFLNQSKKVLQLKKLSDQLEDGRSATA